MNDITIGIIGCGKQAQKHINGLLALEGVQIILADSKIEHAQNLAEQYNLSWVEGSDDLFVNPAVHAIDICTPTPSHFPLIVNALKNGKDFFCEKPLCEELRQARYIVELMEQAQCIGMVGFIYRFVHAFEAGKALFKSAGTTGKSMELGQILSAHFRIGGRGSHQLWKHCISSGGGVINEMLVHMLDLVLWYFGEIKEASLLIKEILQPQRIIQGKKETVDAEDYVVVRVSTKSGVEILCQADLLTPAFTQMIEVQGEDGSFMASIQSDLPSYVYCKQATQDYKAGKTFLKFEENDIHKLQMAEFIRSVCSRQPSDRCSVRDSVHLLAVLHSLKMTGTYENNLAEETAIVENAS